MNITMWKYTGVSEEKLPLLFNSLFNESLSMRIT